MILLSFLYYLNAFFYLIDISFSIIYDVI